MPFYPFTLSLILVPAQVDTSLAERFRSEAPKAWKEYLGRMEKTHGSITVTMRLDNKITMKSNLLVKQRPGCALLLSKVIYYGGKPDYLGETCEALNPHYAFRLKRSDPKRPWIMGNLIFDWQEISPSHVPLEELAGLLSSPVTFLGIHFRNLLDEPGFLLQNPILVTKNDETYVKMSFDFTPKEYKPVIPAAKGYVLFDLKHYWVIKELEADLIFTYPDMIKKTHGKRKVFFEYLKNKDNSFPALKKITLITSGGKTKVTSNTEYNLREEEVPESDFYLAAFGLPEPKRPTRRTPWFLLFGLAGIIGLSLALWLRWRKRRGKASPG